jgi:hypothetical protein
MFHNPLVRPVTFGGAVLPKAFMITVKATYMSGMLAPAHLVRQSSGCALMPCLRSSSAPTVHSPLSGDAVREQPWRHSRRLSRSHRARAMAAKGLGAGGAPAAGRVPLTQVLGVLPGAWVHPHAAPVPSAVGWRPSRHGGRSF